MSKEIQKQLNLSLRCIEAENELSSSVCVQDFDNEEEFYDSTGSFEFDSKFKLRVATGDDVTAELAVFVRGKMSIDYDGMELSWSDVSFLGSASPFEGGDVADAIMDEIDNGDFFDKLDDAFGNPSGDTHELFYMDAFDDLRAEIATEYTSYRI